MTDKLHPQELIEQGSLLLEKTYGLSHRWTADGGYCAPVEWLRALIDSVRAEVKTVEDLPALARFAFVEVVDPGPAALKALHSPQTPAVLGAFARQLGRLECASPEQVTALFETLRAEFRGRAGMRGRDVMFAVRSALTGMVEGPCLEVVVCLLGRARSIERVRRQLSLLEIRNDAAHP